ncbi:MAG: T9SS type A sorting domain-containing protein [Schleiferiaceae bacterium]|nr:T9SS type A sorting domain-containing protein [Schleiferiaceae bacterium]
MPTIPSAGVTYSVTIKSDTVPHPTQGNWDFSNVTTDATGTIEFEPISSTSYSSSYPNATHVKYEDGGTFFLGFDATEYTFHGEMSVITTSYTNPLVLHTYPFAIGNSSTDSELNISFTCNGCPPSMERDDASYSEALASGTLTMPDGTVHSNALLVYNTRTWNDGQTGSPTCNLFLEQWQWWVSGYPMPVAQTVELSTTGPCPPNVGYRQSKFLVGNPIAVHDNEMAPNIIYPNPAEDYIELLSLDHDEIGITISDMSGRILIEKIVSRHSNRINIESLPAGIFVLRTLEDSQNVHRFIKK